MARQQHGHYDAAKGLPDNRGQAVGSGVNVWLQEQIIERIGSNRAQELIQAAATHGAKRKSMDARTDPR